MRLLLGTSFCVQWAGQTDSAEVGMGRGGRQGTVDMPSLWEVYLDHAIGPLLEEWTRKDWRTLIPETALGASKDREESSPPPLHGAETSERLHNTTWAGDLVLVATSAETLTAMAADLLLALNRASLEVKWEKGRCWSMYKPSTIKVAGNRLQAEGDLNILGLSTATGGYPEINARMTAGWRTLHANKVHLTTRRLPKGVRWNQWKAPVGLVLTYGSWRWLWSNDVWSKLDATVHRMVRLMCGPRPAEGKPWVEQALSATRSLVGLEERAHLFLPVRNQPLRQAVGCVAEMSWQHFSA